MLHKLIASIKIIYHIQFLILTPKFIPLFVLIYNTSYIISGVKLEFKNYNKMGKNLLEVLGDKNCSQGN